MPIQSLDALSSCPHLHTGLDRREYISYDCRHGPVQSWFKRDAAVGGNSQRKKTTPSHGRAETSRLPNGRPSDVASITAENWTPQGNSHVAGKCSFRQLR